MDPSSFHGVDPSGNTTDADLVVSSRRSDAPDWTAIVAAGVIADDLSPAAVARYAEVPLATAISALDQARAEGAIGADDTVEPAIRARLIRSLTNRRVAEIHAAVARRVLGGAPEDLRRGLTHLREAVTAMPSEELVELAGRAGRFALDVADAEAARDLLLLALDNDLGTDLRREAGRTLDLAHAFALLGDSAGAHARLMRAVLLAEEAGDARLATRAAERFALPADWQAGDPRVMGLLERVQRMPGLDDEDRTRLLATRAWVEARLPIAQTDEGQQVSWIGRPNVARPLAEEALAASAAQSPSTRLLALLAWRHTHRAPQFLTERLERSGEAFALAEQLHAAAEQVEAAVMLAVDALETGDRVAHRAALTTAAAVAERSGDPRLRWRALVPAAGIALMEGDVGAAREIADEAFAAGAASGAPGLLASQWTFTGHLAARHDDGPALTTSFSVDPDMLATSSLGRSGLSLLLARDGRRAEAAAHARATLHQLDEESSILLSLSRLADTAVALTDATLAAELVPLLEPWSGRVVVDANGWWCDGPVDLWLAELGPLAGGTAADRAPAWLDAAETLARSIGDARSLQRIAVTRGQVDRTHSHEVLRSLGLTEREIEVLKGLTAGLTYHAIANRLRYSVSTVRNDAVAIYRKLGVRGRTEAATRAVGLGVDPAELPAG